MAEPILSDNMEKAPTELNLSITSNDINIELSKEFLVELRKNIYHGTYNEDVVDHIVKILIMVDLIYVPVVDSHGGLVRKSPLGRNLLRNSSVDSILNHTMEKMKCWTEEKTGGLIHLNSYCYSEDQYTVSIKEDTMYMCLHSPKTTKDKAQYAVSRETQYVVFNIWNEYNILEDIKRALYSKKSLIRRDLDNSTNNVLIPLDSWTSGLLVYRLPLSVEYGVSTSIGYGVSSFLSNTAYSSQQINTAYPLPLDTAYRSSGTEAEILKELQEVMAEPILSDNMEKAPTELNLSITSNDINIELNKEFLVELRKNIYHGTYNEDVVDHIAKVLKMVDLIYVPGVDSHQLRMKVFPLSLADDAKEWWISEGDEKITTWEELVEKFFCRFYPESYDGEDEMLDEGEN
ncbi:hypothetical protein Tco_1508136 [Tanacetum coccineum]